jgi:prepilin-type N-terminal cleavage/methylation domain-containing protein
MKTLRFRFTLVEVLAVVALISLLAAIGFGAYSYAMNASRESNSKALFKRIEAGLESCRTKFGYYPVSTSFTAISFTLKRDTSLVSAIQFGTDAMSSDYEKEFLRVVDEESLKKNMIKTLNASSVSEKDFDLEDGWGGKIYYRYPGLINKGGYDLVSPGPDGKFGKNNKADPQSDRSDYYSDNEKICDDITNF